MRKKPSALRLHSLSIPAPSGYKFTIRPYLKRCHALTFDFYFPENLHAFILLNGKFSYEIEFFIKFQQTDKWHCIQNDVRNHPK